MTSSIDAWTLALAPDADLIGCGVVLTEERLAETRVHNARADREERLRRAGEHESKLSVATRRLRYLHEQRRLLFAEIGRVEEDLRRQKEELFQRATRIGQRRFVARDEELSEIAAARVERCNARLAQIDRAIVHWRLEYEYERSRCRVVRRAA